MVGWAHNTELEQLPLPSLRRGTGTFSKPSREETEMSGLQENLLYNEMEPEPL